MSGSHLTLLSESLPDATGHLTPGATGNLPCARSPTSDRRMQIAPTASARSTGGSADSGLNGHSADHARCGHPGYACSDSGCGRGHKLDEHRQHRRHHDQRDQR